MNEFYINNAQWVFNEIFNFKMSDTPRYITWLSKKSSVSANPVRRESIRGSAVLRSPKLLGLI